jgi:hypothetical protein
MLYIGEGMVVITGDTYEEVLILGGSMMLLKLKEVDG